MHRFESIQVAGDLQETGKVDAVDGNLVHDKQVEVLEEYLPPRLNNVRALPVERAEVWQLGQLGFPVPFTQLRKTVLAMRPAPCHNAVAGCTYCLVELLEFGITLEDLPTLIGVVLEIHIIDVQLS